MVTLPIGGRTAQSVALNLLRVRRGLHHTHNWAQLVRFALVGASGYVVNLAVFAASVDLLSIDYHIAAPIAFVVSVLNNFWWNRHWTFSAKEDHPAGQALRFFTVSLLAFGFTYVVLLVVVNAGAMKVVAQAIAIVAGTPLSFIGQKLWSFRA